MIREHSGKGWKFPVGVNSHGEVQMSEYEQGIKEVIWLIRSTAHGERVMIPDFGCGIHNFVFASINTVNIGLIESIVRQALTKWEPRISPG